MQFQHTVFTMSRLFFHTKMSNLLVPCSHCGCRPQSSWTPQFRSLRLPWESPHLCPAPWSGWGDQHWLEQLLPAGGLIPRGHRWAEVPHPQTRRCHSRSLCVGVCCGVSCVFWVNQGIIITLTKFLFNSYPYQIYWPTSILFPAYFQIVWFITRHEWKDRSPSPLELPYSHKTVKTRSSPWFLGCHLTSVEKINFVKNAKRSKITLGNSTHIY